MQNGNYCTMKRIRILHTADIHLDASFAEIGADAQIGNRLRAAQQHVFSRIMERAREWPADMVVVAGDLFDNPAPKQETVAFVIETLEHLAPIPIYIAPGNSDPYSPHSSYATELWPENVVIFEPNKWQKRLHPLLDVCIHGIGCNGENDSGAWFSNLHVKNDGRLHIAVAHGTEQANLPAQGNCFAPFDAAAIAHDPLTYLAMGHFHDTTEIRGDFTTVIRYPGTPQARNFNEQGDRCFLEVVIEYGTPSNAAVRVTPISCADILFTSYACTVGTGKDPETDLDGIIEGDPAKQVAQIQVVGTLPSPAYIYLDTLRMYARKRFLHAVVKDETTPEQTPAVLKGQLTCLSRFNETMAQRMADSAVRDEMCLDAYARDIALSACRGHGLPDHDEEVHS